MPFRNYEAKPTDPSLLQSIRETLDDYHARLAHDDCDETEHANRTSLCGCDIGDQMRGLFGLMKRLGHP